MEEGWTEFWGARTVNQWRVDYLDDWRTRMDRCATANPDPSWARVTITAPGDGDVFLPGANIQLTAEVELEEGVTATRVEFSANSETIGSDDTASASNEYSITWEGVDAGGYSLTATLVTESSSVESASVTIQVGAEPTPGAWSEIRAVASGSQLDAVAGPDETIHLIARRYVQLDRDGAVLVDEDQDDSQQGMLDFPPAIAVEADGTVHIVTRHDGSWAEGHDIRYRRRNTDRSWDRDLIVGDRVARNYVVGVAGTGGDALLLSTHKGDDVWGVVNLWGVTGGEATLWTTLDGIWRSDTDARIRSAEGRLSLVSGLCDPNGRAFFAQAAASSALVDTLEDALIAHAAGSGRRGMPDLYLDDAGVTHMTYGAAHEVYYNHYSADGVAAFAEDIRLFHDLGDWHLGVGLSAVAASEDSQIVVALALETDGTHTSPDSELLWAYSTDGGASWSEQERLGAMTDAGEGRHRPRLVALGSRFFLLFEDNADRGNISLTFIDFTTPCIDNDDDGFGALGSAECAESGVDCDDTRADVFPAAEELCDGIDNDCDGDVDEGCPSDPDGGPDADLNAGPDADSSDDGGHATDADSSDAPDGGTVGGASGGCDCGQASVGDRRSLFHLLFPRLIGLG